MPWYPDDFIDEVTARNDIVDIVREYLPLKPSGRGYTALCPFHNEKTASFHVSPERQIYHCFGCGEGGNVITFVMAVERLDFPEAVKLLAERAGMDLPKADPRGGNREKRISRDTREVLYEINRESARFYHKMLYSSEGKAALQYLYSRGLDEKTIRIFGIGFAPDSWDSILGLLEAKGYDREKLLAAGLVVENKEKNSVYDRFRNRIMFPIINPRGQVVGFGGRVMDDSLPKYLNSSDGPIFNKSATLYGLNLTKKVRPLEEIIIVEGYMDVIALHRFGFPQAVASLGTALTAEQARLMRRYSSNIYVAYDGDTAGQKATLRGLDILRETGYRVRVMQFPKGMDPDDVLRTYGPEYFKKLMDKSLGLIDYKFKLLTQEYDLDTPAGKVDFATEAAKILAGVDNLIEREAHIQKIEQMTGIRARVIYDQIEKNQAATGQRKVKRNISGNNSNTRGKKSKTILHSSHIKAEMHLINLLAQGERISEKIIAGLEDLEAQDTLLWELAGIVKGLLSRKREVNPAHILSHIEDEAKAKRLVDIFNIEMEYDNIETFIKDCLSSIKAKQLDMKRQEIQDQLAKIEQAEIFDADRHKSLIKELEMINLEVGRRHTGKEGSS